MDASGDGVGDLEGIRRRLGHLAWLGVDGLWISPCFPSPMADFGYDVADYCDIDPLFGGLADMDRLIAEAHRHDLRVILDLVPNHTSEAHPWFQASRSSRDDPKRNWYVWRDPAPGGGPPNNWLAIFGGSAWEWSEATGQYYLHSFLKEQPDLDWGNPEVEAAMHDVLRFWFDRGVDGFRIDVIHRIAKDPALRDNPVLDPAGGYGGQRHVHDENHPDVHERLRGLRRLADTYPERVLIGEVYLFDPAEVARYYGKGDELHQAFNFSLMQAPYSAKRMREEIERFQELVPEEGWPNQVLSSHDAIRHASRYDDPQHGEGRARLLAMLLLTTRGTPFLYYGEEIGLRNVEIPEDRRQDPLAWTLHPAASRDGERTPMPWEPGDGAGFSSGHPWLPFGDDADTRNITCQKEDAGSLLHLYRDLIALRRNTKTLERGTQRSLAAPAGVFAFERTHRGERVVVALQFGDEELELDLGRGRVRGGISTRWGSELPRDLEALVLGPAEGMALLVDS
ncbi:MAG: DUF3459 domain-containing protein [bacterium]|nr:DUF3459 domain-containing protein [bacterium]